MDSKLCNNTFNRWPIWTTPKRIIVFTEWLNSKHLKTLFFYFILFFLAESWAAVSSLIRAPEKLGFIIIFASLADSSSPLQRLLGQGNSGRQKELNCHTSLTSISPFLLGNWGSPTSGRLIWLLNHSRQLEHPTLEVRAQLKLGTEKTPDGRWGRVFLNQVERVCS